MQVQNVSFEGKCPKSQLAVGAAKDKFNRAMLSAIAQSDKDAVNLKTQKKVVSDSSFKERAEKFFSASIQFLKDLCK